MEDATTVLFGLPGFRVLVEQGQRRQVPRDGQPVRRRFAAGGRHRNRPRTPAATRCRWLQGPDRRHPQVGSRQRSQGQQPGPHPGIGAGGVRGSAVVEATAVPKFLSRCAVRGPLRWVGLAAASA